jgi:hypothetical protein
MHWFTYTEDPAGVPGRYGDGVLARITRSQTFTKNIGAKNPMVGRFVPIPKRADGHYDRDRLDLAIRHGFCIVRWNHNELPPRSWTDCEMTGRLAASP